MAEKGARQAWEGRERRSIVGGLGLHLIEGNEVTVREAAFLNAHLRDQIGGMIAIVQISG